jgi:hypothetical protein
LLATNERILHTNVFVNGSRTFYILIFNGIAEISNKTLLQLNFEPIEANLSYKLKVFLNGAQNNGESISQQSQSSNTDATSPGETVTDTTSTNEEIYSSSSSSEEQTSHSKYTHDEPTQYSQEDSTESFSDQETEENNG